MFRHNIIQLRSFDCIKNMNTYTLCGMWIDVRREKIDNVENNANKWARMWYSCFKCGPQPLFHVAGIIFYQQFNAITASSKAYFHSVFCQLRFNANRMVFCLFVQLLTQNAILKIISNDFRHAIAATVCKNFPIFDLPFSLSCFMEQ